MTVLVICIAVTALILVAVTLCTGLNRPTVDREAMRLVARRRRPDREVDPEAMMRTAVELHRIRRRLDVAYTRVEQRRESSLLRREIRKALEGDDGV